ncbi:TPA: hypothetical protein KLD26_002665, partial [Legionella pneumophila]|nr:hypothetical protein [Legionella pneumophila]
MNYKKKDRIRVPENHAEKALTLGINSKLKLLVMSKASEWVELPPGEIQSISNKHPTKALVIVVRAPMVNGEYVGNHPDLQELTYRDLWLCSSDYYLLEELEKPTTGEALEQNQYWLQLRSKAGRAIEKFEPWAAKQQGKINITDDLKGWIKKEITSKAFEIQTISKILQN